MSDGSDTSLVLASTSRYRAQLLQRLGLSFSIAKPDVDEAPRSGELPADCAIRLAHAKAHAVASKHPQSCVIGSDQVADWQGRPLGKPRDAAAAASQLLAFSGQEVRFHTAVCVIDRSGVVGRALDTTRVVFRQLHAAEVERYVAHEQPLDCAGSFKVEGMGIALFERVVTDDPTALIGLPLIATAALLRGAGFRIP